MAVEKLTIYNDALVDVGAHRLSTITDDVEEQRIITEVYDDCRDEVLMEHMWTFAQARAALIDMTVPAIDIWVTETAYAVDDIISYNSVYYKCLVAHTSDVFTVDLAAADWVLKLDWVTADSYAIGDQVYHTGVNYTCLEAHTSGVFATDLTAVKWIISEEIFMDEDGMTVIYYNPTDHLETNKVSDSLAVVKMEGQRILSNVTDLKIIYTYQNDTPSEYTAQFRKALSGKIAAAICFSLTESRSKAEDLLEKYTKITLPKAISSDSQQGSPIPTRADAWELARMSGVGSGIAGNTGDQTWHPVG